ncbi:MAG: glutamate racemase [Armatimonadota bacterium]
MDLPIGVFDSGLGGLSVVKQIIDCMPNEDIVYFADNAHVPYGERPLEQIRDFAVEITSFLIEKGAKAVVMACNMSSAVALESARLHFPNVPIIGVIEPGVIAALKSSDSEKLGVLATSGTVKSMAYYNIAKSISPNCEVHQQACPKFVPIVESGNAESEEAEAYACVYVEPLLEKGCKSIILGCTHYPYLRKAIVSACNGEDIKIIDPAEETAKVLSDILKSGNMQTKKNSMGKYIFYTSGDTKSFSELGSLFLGRKISANQAVWGADLGRALSDVAV